MLPKIQFPKPLVGIVGVCGSGKTTLSVYLGKNGISCRAIAQEHSYVQDMWLRLTQPHYLVFLEASFETATNRRKLNWTEDEYKVQIARLAHARINSDLVVTTDEKTPEEIFALVNGFIKNANPSNT